MRPLRPALILLVASLATACNGGAPVTLTFAGLVGGQPAACGTTYSGVGSTATDLELEDFRLYVHDVRLVTESGEEVAVTLDDDDWQVDDIALLDFEDGTAGCESGNPGTNATVRGTVPDGSGPFVGVRFRLGVPFDRNHADASTAPAPLSFGSMFWSWNLGYKFLRVDARTTGLPEGWLLHLGSTGCEGDGRGNVSGCAADNIVDVELTGFDPASDTIAVDLADVLSGADLDVNAGGAPGCQSGVDDTDCGPVFDGLGLSFAGTPPSGPQRLFSIRAP
ncbi:MAG: metallo-mystery pair system four-Cys motif protein [Sandaracinaceae bacterium]|nr:metallo-mystery pair system four-Cys motif protein [Sandaracinaceae bacterium]